MEIDLRCGVQDSCKVGVSQLESKQIVCRQNTYLYLFVSGWSSEASVWHWVLSFTCSQWVMSRTVRFKQRDISAVQASRGRWAWQLMCRCCYHWVWWWQLFDDVDANDGDFDDNYEKWSPEDVERAVEKEGSRGLHCSPVPTRWVVTFFGFFFVTFFCFYWVVTFS